jgi:hypothetical protein
MPFRGAGDPGGGEVNEKTGATIFGSPDRNSLRSLALPYNQDSPIRNLRGVIFSQQ